MNQRAEPVASTPLKNAREIAAMLKSLPKDDRLRIEGAIAWAMLYAADQTRAPTPPGA